VDPNLPISICIIVENLPVPTDQRVWKEARTLSAAGYRVSVICPKGPGCETGRETRDGVEIYRHWTWKSSSPLGYVIEYISALTAEFYLAVKVYGRTRFRVLQSCNPPDILFLVAVLFKLLGVRFVFDHHDLSPELYRTKFKEGGPVYALLRIAERLTFWAADVSLATNESFREIAITRGKMSPARVFVVKTGTDLREVNNVLKRPSPKKDRRYLVVYVGIMEAQDGVHLLLESIRYLVKRKLREDVTFALIGSGTETAHLKKLAAQWELGDFVVFTGQIPHEEVGAWLLSSDVCVAPDPSNHLNDKCTMIKVLEYMAYGRPIVMYDLKEGRRAASDAALYARPNNPIDFADQIERLLESECLRKKLGARGSQRVQDDLNWEVQSRNLLEAFRMVLDSTSEHIAEEN